MASQQLQLNSYVYVASFISYVAVTIIHINFSYTVKYSNSTYVHACCMFLKEVTLSNGGDNFMAQMISEWAVDGGYCSYVVLSQDEGIAIDIRFLKVVANQLTSKKCFFGFPCKETYAF